MTKLYSLKIKIMNRMNRFLAVLTGLFICLSLNADYVKIGDFYYEFSPDGKATVLGKLNISGNITIPANVNYNGRSYAVTSIGVGAFEHSTISRVSIPSTIQKINSGAFSYLRDELKGIYITDLTAWCEIEFHCSPLNGTNLFINNKEIQHLKLPSNISKVSAFAFEGCSSIKIIDIPNTLKEIGFGAFRGCKNLTTVNCYAQTPPLIDYDTFSNCRNIILHVLRGKKSIYKDTQYWKDFKEIIDDL